MDLFPLVGYFLLGFGIGFGGLLLIEATPPWLFVMPARLWCKAFGHKTIDVDYPGYSCVECVRCLKTIRLTRSPLNVSVPSPQRNE